jgi:hypothetical protein
MWSTLKLKLSVSLIMLSSPAGWSVLSKHVVAEPKGKFIMLAVFVFFALACLVQVASKPKSK